ncbi:type 2 lanthipeptide synthetase LanM family protein [Paenibacillus sp. FSL P2-0322]|uniref:type 2 lanthipeptide synthetase LanM family protein n=1 Tax=Paenibacillus sp. FSL P2-0322 TaxID=2921628 RepID=UPI0030CD7275
MVNVERAEYWSEFFYSNELYLRQSLKEVSDIDIEDASELLRYRSDWKIQWRDLINREVEARNFLNEDSCSFSGFVVRFLLFAQDLLDDKQNEQLSRLIIKDAIYEHFFAFLTERVVEYSYKTLILELNVLREQCSLKGDSSEDKYRYFESLLWNVDYLSQLADEYPVLISTMLQVTKRYVEHLKEVMTRFKTDISDIISFMPEVGFFGKVIKFRIGAGDSHNGRSVTILEFESGNKLVYKPRSLAVDKRYYDFLSWLNQFDLPNMQVIRTIDRKEYGWSEFVQFSECKSLEEVERFYFRMGVHLAIMYMFNATDFHYENIIAMGEQPIIIDLESLFHQTLNMQLFANDANGHAYKILSNSVMSSGMLPQYVYRTRVHQGIDVSGIFGYGDQEIPNSSLRIIHGRTDKMRLERGASKTDKTYNIPYYDGRTMDSYRYLSEIKQGFRQAYQIIIGNKTRIEQLIGEFSYDRVRVILRNTRSYVELLRTLKHPDLLRDELDHKVVVHRLWLQCLANREHLNFVKYEMRDIEASDVPYFYTYPASKDVWASNGDVISDVFRNSGIEIVMDKIGKMDIHDLEEQLELLNMSISAARNDLYVQSMPKLDSYSSDLTDLQVANWKDEYIQIATSIGDTLIQSAVTSSDMGCDEATWIGLLSDSKEERRLRLVPVGYDLYNGNSGIALFLAYLFDVTGNRAYKNMALQALKPLINIMENKFENSSLTIGAYNVNSIGGGIFAAYQLSLLWNDTQLLQVIKGFLPYYIQHIENDTLLDYIGGAAGAIDILLHIYYGTGWELALQGAEKCAEHLLQNARTMPDGSVVWAMNLDNIPYVGYSHGISGIVAPLSSLYRVNHRKEYIDYIARGLRYERVNYDSRVKNWITPKEPARVTWCHGAPGILLSRLRLLENGYWDEYIDEEIKNALSTTIQSGFGIEPVYCHGDFGNLEILLAADKVLNNPDIRKTIDTVRMYLLKFLQNNPWKNTGIHRGFDIKGLMGGLAGIGFGLLKQVNPDRVPNILNLENKESYTPHLLRTAHREVEGG